MIPWRRWWVRHRAAARWSASNGGDTVTGNEIKVAAMSYLNEPLNDYDVILAINEFLTWLGDMANLFGDTTITATGDGAWQSLPQGFISATIVLDDTGARCTDFEIVGKMIRFPNAGTYTIKYRRPANRITQTSDTLEISDLFRVALVNKVASWVMLRRDDEDINGTRLNGEWMQDAARVASSLASGNSFGPKVVRVIR